MRKQEQLVPLAKPFLKEFKSKNIKQGEEVLEESERKVYCNELTSLARFVQKIDRSPCISLWVDKNRKIIHYASNNNKEIPGIKNHLKKEKIIENFCSQFEKEMSKVEQEIKKIYFSEDLHKDKETKDFLKSILKKEWEEEINREKIEEIKENIENLSKKIKAEKDFNFTKAALINAGMTCDDSVKILKSIEEKNDFFKKISSYEFKLADYYSKGTKKEQIHCEMRILEAISKARENGSINKNLMDFIVDLLNDKDFTTSKIFCRLCHLVIYYSIKLTGSKDINENLKGHSGMYFPNWTAPTFLPIPKEEIQKIKEKNDGSKECFWKIKEGIEKYLEENKDNIKEARKEGEICESIENSEFVQEVIELWKV